MKDAVLDELRKHFRPEFLNRVDEIIVFHALTEAHLKKIVDIQLGRLRKRLAERNITLELTDAAKEHLVRVGLRPGVRRAAAEAGDPEGGRDAAGAACCLKGEVRDGRTRHGGLRQGEERAADSRPSPAPGGNQRGKRHAHGISRGRVSSSAIMPFCPVHGRVRRADMSSPWTPTPITRRPSTQPRSGLGHVGRVWANLSPAALTEHAIRRGEALLTDLGAVAAYTGNRTGRSPKDKFTVKEA